MERISGHPEGRADCGLRGVSGLCRRQGGQTPDRREPRSYGNRVGAKGQVVISKPTRDLLDIRPGFEALEQVVDDHVEIRFIPPPQERSLLTLGPPGP